MTTAAKVDPWFPEAAAGAPAEAPPAPVPAAGGRLQRIPLAELHESPLNPRQHYDPAALDELMDSLLSGGQLTPITVRPRKGGGYEIGAGHRRYRAAKLAAAQHAAGAAHAQLGELLAVVRDLEDRAFIELLNIENLQRDDLHPLEEAQGFRDLMEKVGYDIRKLAARTGKSESYVYDRLKLLRLIKPAQKLFRQGKFTAGHAILLARLSTQDQARAIDLDGIEHWRLTGLFTVEHAHGDGALDTGEDDTAVKPVSVREFADWIDDHVRFVPEKEDLPSLFPETGRTLKAAAEAEEKVVKITHDYRVPDDAKPDEGPGSKERVYTAVSWKRADGEVWEDPRTLHRGKSKTCEHAVTGVIVIGPGRGQAFKVCVAKDKCGVHWPKMKAAKPGSRKERDYERPQRDYERQQRAQQAQRDRFEKAVPAILEALIAAIRKAPASARGSLADLLVDEFRLSAKAQLTIGRGTSAEDLVRHLALLVVRRRMDGYDAPRELPLLGRWLGVNVKRILDQVAPEQLHKCEGCGCDESHACSGGCSWDPGRLKKKHYVCSTCVKAKGAGGPLRVKCPTCSAAPGKKCKRPSGHDVLNGKGVRGWHDARSTAAAKAQ